MMICTKYEAKNNVVVCCHPSKVLQSMMIRVLNPGVSYKKKITLKHIAFTLIKLH